MNKLIAPSVLSADFGRLREEIEMINSSEADWIHLDIMDGVFVPNISFGFPVLKQIHEYATKPLDVHLMMIHPEKYFERFCDYGASILSVHYEACTHLHRSVYAIKDLGMQAGVVLNPHTPLNVLEEIINDIDLVLIMSVNPGFGGQKFINGSFNKVTKLRNFISSNNLKVKIEVDGGVDLSNSGKLYQSGADILVAGNSIFNSENPKEMIARIKNS